MSKTITKLTKTMTIAAIASTSILLAGTSPAHAQTSTEMYYIFDIKTDASRQEVSEAIRKGLKKYASKIHTTSPIVMDAPPVEPKKFEIVDVSSQFGGGNFGGLMDLARAQSGGLAFKTAKCDGAVWTGNFTRDISSQTLRMNLCLFPYQGGYSLNVYGQDTHKKVRGPGLSGHIGGMIAQEIVDGALGGPQKWTQRAFRGIRKRVYKDVGVLAVLQEGQPQIDFSFKDEPAAATVQQPSAATQLVSQPVNTAPVVHSPAADPATAAPAISCKGLSDAQCLAKMRAAE